MLFQKSGESRNIRLGLVLTVALILALLLPLAHITAQEVEEQLGAQIDLILDGGSCRAGVPSTILDCTVSPPRLLRRGAVSAAARPTGGAMPHWAANVLLVSPFTPGTRLAEPLL